MIYDEEGARQIISQTLRYARMMTRAGKDVTLEKMVDLVMGKEGFSDTVTLPEQHLAYLRRCLAEYIAQHPGIE